VTLISSTNYQRRYLVYSAATMHQRSESYPESLRVPDTFRTFQFLSSISSHVPVAQCSLGMHTQKSSDLTTLVMKPVCDQ
jgi:hypothetical protein